ncbi:NADP-dependent oxidoreductase domain-containing protein [Fennellomyces sp. T-0311]|nr:NADP-dependent oxidoreductase domain-containing protein [Fennellomyces sp. T-0311]
MAPNRTFKLNTGDEIPALGFGTGEILGDKVYQAVLTAIKAGYRHIDTAYAYGNEKEVGKAIKDSNVPREELFVTTKLWNTFHKPDLVAKGFEKSLDNLGLDYIDLYLMHWPISFAESEKLGPMDKNGQFIYDTTGYTETYSAMEKLVGPKLRAIGVSNFNFRSITKLLEVCTLVPAVIQIEIHPYLTQPDIFELCKKNNIHLTAYSALGCKNSPLLKDSIVIEISAKYNATPAQVLLSWGIQRGTSVVTKSTNESRIIENLRNIHLEQADFDKLNPLITEPKSLNSNPFFKMVEDAMPDKD